MRVALVSETFLPSIDGVVTRLVKAIDWLADHGHDPVVVAPGLGVTEYRGVPVLGVRTARYPVYRSRPWGTPDPAVARHLAAFSPDLVHAWQPALVGLPAVRWCTRTSTPLVTSYHTDVSRYLDYYGPLRLLRRPIMAYQRSLANKAPITLVTSDSMRDRLVAEGFTGVRVLPRGVDLEARDPRFKDPAMRSRLSAGHPDDRLLLYVGRLAAEKNLASLAPALASHADWRLAFVGDGPERADLEAAFPKERTVFTGFLSGGELSAAFASADAFVFPSTTETLGLVILEAQASGVPVVAAKSPATECQLRDRADALLYDPSDPGALESRLVALFSEPGLSGALAANARAKASSNGWDQAGAALYAYYEQALALYSEGWGQRGRKP